MRLKRRLNHCRVILLRHLKTLWSGLKLTCSGLRVYMHKHQRAFLRQSILLKLFQLIALYWFSLKVSTAFSIETFSDILLIFLKQLNYKTALERKGWDCEVLLCVVATFLLAVGINIYRARPYHNQHQNYVDLQQRRILSHVCSYRYLSRKVPHDAHSNVRVFYP